MLDNCMSGGTSHGFDQIAGKLFSVWRKAWAGLLRAPVRVLAVWLISVALPPAAQPVQRTMEIGEIPSIEVRHGSLVEFQVTAPGLTGVAQIHAIPSTPPRGRLGVDQYNKFIYEPSSDDKYPFKVLFSAASNGRVVRQVVDVTPIPLLPPEAVLVGEHAMTSPAPDDERYTTISENAGGERREFNETERTPRDLVVAGYKIVFKPGYQVAALSGAKDIGNLEIHADEVIVGMPVDLPQTNLRIWARKLVFEDPSDPQQYARIITTPLDPKRDRPVPAATTLGVSPEKAQDGHPAGSIELRVDELWYTTDGRPRFVLDGGKGQNGGRGREGNPGEKKARANANANCRTAPDEYIYYEGSSGSRVGRKWGPWWRKAAWAKVLSVSDGAGNLA